MFYSNLICDLYDAETPKNCSEVCVGFAEAANDDGTFLDPSDGYLVYKSSDDAVTRVSAGGIVQFVRPGVVTITATMEGVSGATVFVVK